MSVNFYLAARGGSAGINSAEFYVCGECGACIVEMDLRDHSRNAHTDWHQSLAAPSQPEGNDQ